MRWIYMWPTLGARNTSLIESFAINRISDDTFQLPTIQQSRDELLRTGYPESTMTSMPSCGTSDYVARPAGISSVVFDVLMSVIRQTAMETRNTKAHVAHRLASM